MHRGGQGGVGLVAMFFFSFAVSRSVLKVFLSSMDCMSTESSARIFGYKSTILLSPHLGSAIVDFMVSNETIASRIKTFFHQNVSEI